MGALSGSIAERSRAAIAAGCDVVLHCNGRLDEMREVAAAVPALTGQAAARADAALAWRRVGRTSDLSSDLAALRAEWGALMAALLATPLAAPAGARRASS
jgi:beta-N-acetylhexosaminidase